MPKIWSPKSGNNGQGEWLSQPATTTLASLRKPAKYWVISDVQLKRDLKGRTLADVYRDNHAGRIADSNAGIQYGPRFGKYEPRQEDARGSLRSEYLAWCAARGHVPHPASIDSDHPQNCHRERMPKAEKHIQNEHSDHVFREAA